MTDPELIGSIIRAMDLDPRTPHRRFARHWLLWSDEGGRSYPLPPGWRSLITALAEAGVLDEGFAEAIGAAMGYESAGTYGLFRATVGECRRALERDGGLEVHPRRLADIDGDPGSPSIVLDPHKAERLFRAARDEEARRMHVASAIVREEKERLAEWRAGLGPYVFNATSGAYHYVECVNIQASRGLFPAANLPSSDNLRCPPCKGRARQGES